MKKLDAPSRTWNYWQEPKKRRSVNALTVARQALKNTMELTLTNGLTRSQCRNALGRLAAEPHEHPRDDVLHPDRSAEHFCGR
jgi:hypothetical protein